MTKNNMRPYIYLTTLYAQKSKTVQQEAFKSGELIRISMYVLKPLFNNKSQSDTASFKHPLFVWY